MLPNYVLDPYFSCVVKPSAKVSLEKSWYVLELECCSCRALDSRALLGTTSNSYFGSHCVQSHSIATTLELGTDGHIVGTCGTVGGSPQYGVLDLQSIWLFDSLRYHEIYASALFSG